MVKAKPYKSHPAADIFPMLEGVEYERLKADIIANGQREGIDIWQGMVIDGRNRYRICLDIGKEPDCWELEECKDPIAYVLSKNLCRRNLKPSQAAMCAAKTCNLTRGVNKKDTSKDVSIDDAARIFGIGRASIERALSVLRAGCEPLVRQCEQGDVSVSLGAKFVEEVDDKTVQAEVAKGGKKAIKDYITPNDEVTQEEPIREAANASALSAFRKLWDASDDMGRAAIRAFVLDS